MNEIDRFTMGTIEASADYVLGYVITFLEMHSARKDIQDRLFAIGKEYLDYKRKEAQSD